MAIQCTRPGGRELVTARRAFGEALQRHREGRGITLEQISERTKIAVALLVALERGDCSRWPAGIYSRAYIREYAQAIGLDRDEVAARFSECFSETAFPEGRTAAKETAAAPPPPVTAATPAALRLILDEPPHARLLAMASRGAALAIDLLLTLLLAVAVDALSSAGFWMSLACVSVSVQSVGVLRRGTNWHPVVRVAGSSSPSRANRGASDHALAEAA